VDVKPFHGGRRKVIMVDSVSRVRGHRKPKDNQDSFFGRGQREWPAEPREEPEHMEQAIERWSVDPRREPEPAWESMEQCEEGYRRMMLAKSRLQLRRVEDRVISPVPSVLAPLIRSPVRLPSPVRHVPAPCTRPEEPETVREAMGKLEERDVVQVCSAQHLTGGYG
jgi:hypothetical protein